MKTALTAGLFIFALIAGPVTAFGQDAVATTDSDGAVLRGLDTNNGLLRDLPIKTGQTITFERLEITLRECRYPSENPAADAFAHLTIRDIREEKPRFDGWMVASSPALSAMDHPRYDVWVLRCIIPKAPEDSDG